MQVQWLPAFVRARAHPVDTPLLQCDFKGLQLFRAVARKTPEVRK